MTIRKLVAATAIAGGFVLAGSGLAFADQSQTAQSLAPGARVCVEIPSTSDPVRAEGLGDRGVTFTLTVDDGVVAQTADPTTNSTFRTEAGSALAGAVRFCAYNGGDADAWVNLDLASDGPEDAGVLRSNATTVVSSATGFVSVSLPVPETPAPAQSSSDASSVLDQIHQLIEQVIAQFLGALAAVA